MRVVSNPPSSSPMPPRRRMRAADVPEVLAQDEPRDHLPYSMLAKEWEWWPRDREAMIVEEPVSDNAADLCRIACVVHALCDRDGVKVPNWVFEHRSDQPLPLFASIPTAGSLWERVKADAPTVCAYHNVWFDNQSIEPLASAAKRIKRARRKRRWFR